MGFTKGQDVYMVDGPFGTPDKVVECANHFNRKVVVRRLRDILINQGRIQTPFSLPSDCGGIFEIGASSRRETGPATLEDHEPLDYFREELMLDWLYMCYEDPSPGADVLVPGDMEPFESVRCKVSPYVWIPNHGSRPIAAAAR